MRFPRSACVLALVAAVPALVMARPVADDPPWLGVAIINGIHGVQIGEVIDDTPAAHAGLEPGDEVLVVAGEKVAAPADLIAVVGKHRIAERIDLTVWRAGRTFRVGTVLAAKPSEDEILHRRLVGKPAPAFDVPVIIGDHAGDLDDLRGRVVVLAFTAIQCDSCEIVHRRLSRVADQHAVDGISVLVVSRESKEALEAWSRSLAPSFTIVHDLIGALANAYRVPELPTLVVVDQDGMVVYAGIGGGDNLDGALLAALRARGLRPER